LQYYKYIFSFTVKESVNLYDIQKIQFKKQIIIN